LTTFIDAIGNTPMITLDHLRGEGEGRIWLKLETFNPGGSIKDRAALGMIRGMEKDGTIKPGFTLVEPTAGNTGVGFALVGRALGYKVVIVMPEGYSQEKQILIKALGATLIITPQDQGMPAAIERANEIASKNPQAACPQQFSNPHNPAIHQATTGAEILRDRNGEIDGFVVGAGTGGTFTGVMRALRKHNSEIKGFLADPPGSVLSGQEPGKHKVEGIGNSFSLRSWI